MAKVHEEFATGGFKDFLSATSGRITRRQLAQLGHPYRTGIGGVKSALHLRKSARKGQVRRSGAVSVLPINAHSGLLRRRIKLVAAGSRSRRTFRLFSDAPYAKYVLSPTGTKRMVPRELLGPFGYLRKRHKARSAALIDVVRRSQRR